jgi:D-alanine-D-alanine ligase
VRVAVLSGGRSSEHEVSLASGASVREGLASAGHDVLDVRLAPDGTWSCGDDELELCPGRGLLGADVVFPALHGPYGEDGTVQGLLELLDVAYVGAGVLASAVCMDKVVFKDLMAQAGVPQVDYVGLVAGTAAGPSPEEIVERLGLPCWVKPARLGSSVGIARVDSAGELPGALREAFGHDPRVLVAASASGLEVEGSALGPTDAPRCSVPGEIVLLRGAGWYDYEAKYTDGGMQLQVPARISGTAAARVHDLALRAFTLSGCSGLARADFFVDGEGVLLNELNTMPGQTPTSVYGKLWAESGLPYPQLLERLCEVGRERFARERAVRF